LIGSKPDISKNIKELDIEISEFFLVSWLKIVCFKTKTITNPIKSRKKNKSNSIKS